MPLGLVGPTHGDGADVLDVFETREVNSVFELVFAVRFDLRQAGDEALGHQALIGVANVFGEQRQQDTTRSRSIDAAEECEQLEERRLAAGGDADVVGGQLPAE